MLRELAEEAADRSRAEAYNAANRRRVDHGDEQRLLPDQAPPRTEYDDLRAGLRMNVIGNPGVEKADFELWSLAVSAINGCGHCLDSHEQVLRKAGVSREVIFESLRAAAIVAGVGQAVASTEALASARRLSPFRRLCPAGVERPRSGFRVGAAAARSGHGGALAGRSAPLSGPVGSRS